ncbi:tRNA dihydrouridine synthase [Fragilaria crotonensis]|nr:tRNA dihydrouridine synthase [Fragilaria crotonensis]
MENSVTVEIAAVECKQGDADAQDNGHPHDIQVTIKSGSSTGASATADSDSNTQNVSETVTRSTDPEPVPNNDRSKNHHSDQYELKVRKEYIVNERPKCLDPLPGTQPATISPTADTDGLHNDTERSDSAAGQKKQDKNKDKKGMNKKRPRDKRAPDNEKLCLFVVRGEPCPHNTTCKFSHDVDEYIRTKPQDLTNIQGGCPSFRIQGFCRYGICCRLAGTHTTKAGTNINATNTSINTDDNDESKTTLNVLDRQVLTQLRKNQFPFVCPRNPFQGKQMPEAARKIFSAPLPKDDNDNSPRQHKKTIDFSGKVYIAPPSRP